jgi:hypothetical protein
MRVVTGSAAALKLLENFMVCLSSFAKTIARKARSYMQK